MEIKPIKNYKKPNYAVKMAAVVACVGAISGCSDKLAKELSVITGGAGNSAETTTTQELQIAGMEQIYTQTETQLAGDVAIQTDTTTRAVDTLTGTVAVPIVVTTTTELQLDGDTQTVTETSVTEDDLLGGAVQSSINESLSGLVAVTADTTTTEEYLELEGDVAVLYDYDGISENLVSGFQSAGLSDFDASYELLDYYGDIVIASAFKSENAKLFICYFETYDGCETDGYECTVLGNRTGEGLADKYQYGYIDTVNYDNDEYTVVFIDLAAHPSLSTDDVDSIITELKSRKII